MEEWNGCPQQCWLVLQLGKDMHKSAEVLQCLICCSGIHVVPLRSMKQVLGYNYRHSSPAASTAGIFTRAGSALCSVPCNVKEAVCRGYCQIIAKVCCLQTTLRP